MQITTETTYKDFFLVFKIFNLGDKQIDEVFENIKDYPVIPEFEVNFNDLIFGKLCDLQGMKTSSDLLFGSFKILLNIDKETILNYKAADCLRFVLLVKTELERITKLFNAIQYKPTSEEVQAGINKLSHGFFGTADWYARRMGIADHEQVFQTNWMRIYRTMKIDFDNNSFERNYRKVIDRKNKKK